MKVKTKHAVRVKRGKGHKDLDPGTTVDLSEAVATDLIDRGAAEPLDKPPYNPSRKTRMPSRGDDLEAVTAGDVVSHLGNRPAVYRSQDGTELRELNGIFRRAYVEMPGEFAGTAVRKPTYTTLAAYWPETFKPQVSGTLEVVLDPETITTYRIQGAEPDGTGLVVLVLEGL